MSVYGNNSTGTTNSTLLIRYSFLFRVAGNMPENGTLSKVWIYGYYPSTSQAKLAVYDSSFALVDEAAAPFTLPSTIGWTSQDMPLGAALTSGSQYFVSLSNDYVGVSTRYNSGATDRGFITYNHGGNDPVFVDPWPGSTTWAATTLNWCFYIEYTADANSTIIVPKLSLATSGYVPQVLSDTDRAINIPQLATSTSFPLPTQKSTSFISIPKLALTTDAKVPVRKTSSSIGVPKLSPAASLKTPGPQAGTIVDIPILTLTESLLLPTIIADNTPSRNISIPKLDAIASLFSPEVLIEKGQTVTATRTYLGRPICPRCGMTVREDIFIKERHTGQDVCPDCLDTQNPQEYIRVRPERPSWAPAPGGGTNHVLATFMGYVWGYDLAYFFGGPGGWSDWVYRGTTTPANYDTDYGNLLLESNNSVVSQVVNTNNLMSRPIKISVNEHDQGLGTQYDLFYRYDNTTWAQEANEFDGPAWTLYDPDNIETATFQYIQIGIGAYYEDLEATISVPTLRVSSDLFLPSALTTGQIAALPKVSLATLLRNPTIRASSAVAVPKLSLSSDLKIPSASSSSDISVVLGVPQLSVTTSLKTPTTATSSTLSMAKLSVGVVPIAPNVVPSGATVADYYVDFTLGNDANNGTSDATPWKNMSKVNSTTFAPGDVIAFKAGETWPTPLTCYNSGTVTNPITYTRYGVGNNPKVDVNQAYNNCIYINGQYVVVDSIDVEGAHEGGTATLTQGNGIYCTNQHATIKNLTATANDRSGVMLLGNCSYSIVENVTSHTNIGVNMRPAGIESRTNGSAVSHNLTIKNCVCYENKWRGISIRGVNNSNRSTNCVVDGCVIYNNGDGVYFDFGDGHTVKNCVIYDNEYDHLTGYGGEVCGVECRSSRNTKIYDNEIYSNLRAGVHLWGSAGDGDSNGCQIYRNYIYNHNHTEGPWSTDDEGQAIFISATEPYVFNTQIWANLIINNRNGISDNGPQTGMKIYNNTFASQNTFCIRLISSSGAGEVRNNLFYQNNDSAQYDIVTSGGYNITHSNNHFYDTTHYYAVNDDGVTYTTSTVTSWEATATTGDPTFAAGSGVDVYKLDTGSPCINTGYTVGSPYNTDYWGTTRPQGASYDKGAHEKV